MSFVSVANTQGFQKEKEREIKLQIANLCQGTRVFVTTMNYSVSLTFFKKNIWRKETILNTPNEIRNGSSQW